MEFAISPAGFEGQNLAVKPASFWKGSSLLLNGIPVKRAKGFYSVTNNAGSEVLIKLKSNFFDPIPKVIIGSEVIQLVRPLKWYEYVWMGLPILLVLQGGGLGAAIGLFATHANGGIFRSERSGWVKYALTALISIGATLTFLILAVVLVNLIHSL